MRRSHACPRMPLQALPRCAMLSLLCREEEAKRKDYQVVNTEECVWGLDEEWDAQVGSRLHVVWWAGMGWYGLYVGQTGEERSSELMWGGC